LEVPILHAQIKIDNNYNELCFGIGFAVQLSRIDTGQLSKQFQAEKDRWSNILK
jgi:hypothetical protein